MELLPLHHSKSQTSSGWQDKEKCQKEKQEVAIEKVTHNKQKSINTVKGLDLFGVKLSDASMKLGKKFATGASVLEGPTEKEHMDVQVDIAYVIVEFITGR